MVKCMWRISYINNQTNEVLQKCGFKTDKEALDWATEEEAKGNICALKLLVWRESIQCYRVVEDL